MTPTEVWEGFNPVKDPLETSIISSEETDNFVDTKVFFTSEKTARGRVRVFADIYFDSRWQDDRAAIIIAPTVVNNTDYSSIVKSLVASGYVVCIVDYCGSFASNTNHTSFPQDLSFAASPECSKFLNSFDTDAHGSPWFQWAKIIRRTISMLSEHRLVSRDRIGIIGFGGGAQLAWQTAGIDGRICALTAINGGGYLWVKNNTVVAEACYIPSTDQERAFSTGVGAETYARFVTCPTCIVSSSNSSYSGVDKVGDMLASVPAKCKQLIISPSTNVQISNQTFQSILKWLEQNFTHDGSFNPVPTLAFKQIEGKLYLRLCTDKNASTMRVYINFGEAYSAVRHWESLGDAQQIDQNEFTYVVSIADISQPVYAYATIEYEDGILRSTPIASVTPSKIGVTVSDGSRVVCGSLIYNGSMGLSSFSAETNNAILGENLLSVKVGPFNIKGITTEMGNLVLYKRFRGNFPPDSNMFQFDAYSKEKKQISVKFFTYPDLNFYTASITLDGGEFWQKVRLSTSDFKNEIGRTLQKFGDVKMLVFADAQGVLFNNLLWV